MTLLRWIHLRKLVPLSELIDGLEKGGGPSRPAAPPRLAPPPPRSASGPPPRPSVPAMPPVQARTVGAGSRPNIPAAAPAPGSGPASSKAPQVADRPQVPAARSQGRPTETTASLPSVEPVAPDRLKDAFLEEVRKVKKFFHGTVIAQAQRIDVNGDQIVLTFAPQHRALRSQLEQTRPLLETLASQLAGRKMAVVSAEGTAAAAPARGAEPAGPPDQAEEKKNALREQALADSGVQAMLDVFSAEIRDVEER
jgi:hypothetical protein